MSEVEEKLLKVLQITMQNSSPSPGYTFNYCPIFWKNVFEKYYGSPPQDDNDPRWDELFKLGFPLFEKGVV